MAGSQRISALPASGDDPAVLEAIMKHLNQFAPVLFAALVLIGAVTSSLAQDDSTVNNDTLAAAPEAPSETGEPEGRTFMGESDFYLNGEYLEIEDDGEVITSLDARANVILETSQLTIVCSRLLYSERTNILRAYGDEDQPCFVKQAGTLTRCFTFIYNRETGEAQFFGDPEIGLEDDRESGSKMLGSAIFLEKLNDQSLSIVERPAVMNPDFIGPDFTQLENEFTVNPTINLSTAERPDKKRRGGDLPYDILSRGKKTVIPITPTNFELITDNSVVEIDDIEAEDPYARSSEESGGVL
jgi:hypothetical protein